MLWSLRKVLKYLDRIRVSFSKDSKWFFCLQLLNTPIEDLERDNLPDCVTSSAYDHSNMMPTGIEGRISPEMFGFEDFGGSVIEG